MKYKPVFKFSLVNLTLNVIAVISAVILPGKETKVFTNGHIEMNSCGQGNFVQATCKEGEVFGSVKCDFTQTNADNMLSFTSIYGQELGTSGRGVTTVGGGKNTGTDIDSGGTLITGYN